MADSLLSRLAAAFAPAKAVVTGTGGTGSGVYAMTYDVPVWSASRNPNRLMEQAQRLFHTNPWVFAAERLISGRLAAAPWHLEDAQQETIESDAGEVGELKTLLEKPQANLPPGQRQTGLETRSKLWRLTSRHTGLCGTSFWLLNERNAITGIPRSVLYLNPALMFPKFDRNRNLASWLYRVDPNEEAGLALSLEEVLPFYFEPPDTGVFGVGIVEAAGMKADLTKRADIHAAGVLGSGGRLPGIISPKEGMLSGDPYDSLVKNLRTIVDLPDAAKRTLVAQAPLDFHATSSSPKDLNLLELANSGRDDVLAIWNVPVSQIGISLPAGLNSGETKNYDEAILWQNAIHPRVEAMRETIQYGLLDRAAAPPTLVIQEPSFDDERPKYEVASKAQNLPLTNNERRSLVGLDDFPDELLGSDGKPLGLAVYMPATLVPVTAEPEPVSAPVQPPPFTGGEQTAEAETDDLSRNVEDLKARTNPLAALRGRTLPTYEPRVRKAVQTALAKQRDEIVGRVRRKHAHLLKRPNDLSVWWSDRAFKQALTQALTPHLAGLSHTVVANVTNVLKPEGKADLDDAIEQRVLKRAGARITGIAETTRDDVARLIGQGIERGLGAAELGDLIEGATTFDEARAEMIARTETALVYNESTIMSGREYGVERWEAIDGDKDAECAARNGKVFDADEALGITDHPNGTLDWLPVFGKASLTAAAMQPWGTEDIGVTPEDLAAIRQAIADGFAGFAKASLSPGGIVNLHLPAQLEIPPPQVTVNVPEQKPPTVTVHPPQVTVNVPEPKAPAKAKLDLPTSVKVVSMPNRVHKAVRGRDGRIEGSMEVDADGR